MNERDEYIEFWVSIKNKVDDIQREYSKLSETNKKRANCAVQSIFHANTLYDALRVINEQLR